MTDSLSTDAIKQRLQELERDRQELEYQLALQHKAQRKGYVESLRQDIRANGYEVEEIAVALLPKGFIPRELWSKDKAAISKPSASGARYVDPNNPQHTYVRGVLPGWMKQQMLDNGLNPDIKDDRKRFKQEHLQWVKE